MPMGNTGSHESAFQPVPDKREDALPFNASASSPGPQSRISDFAGRRHRRNSLSDFKQDPDQPASPRAFDELDELPCALLETPANRDLDLDLDLDQADIKHDPIGEEDADESDDSSESEESDSESQEEPDDNDEEGQLRGQNVKPEPPSLDVDHACTSPEPRTREQPSSPPRTFFPPLAKEGSTSVSGPNTMAPHAELKLFGSDATPATPARVAGSQPPHMETPVPVPVLPTRPSGEKANTKRSRQKKPSSGIADEEIQVPATPATTVVRKQGGWNAINTGGTTESPVLSRILETQQSELKSSPPLLKRSQNQPVESRDADSDSDDDSVQSIPASLPHPNDIASSGVLGQPELVASQSLSSRRSRRRQTVASRAKKSETVNEEAIKEHARSMYEAQMAAEEKRTRKLAPKPVFTIPKTSPERAASPTSSTGSSSYDFDPADEADMDGLADPEGVQAVNGGGDVSYVKGLESEDDEESWQGLPAEAPIAAYTSKDGGGSDGSTSPDMGFSQEGPVEAEHDSDSEGEILNFFDHEVTHDLRSGGALASEDEEEDDDDLSNITGFINDGSSDARSDADCDAGDVVLSQVDDEMSDASSDDIEGFVDGGNNVRLVDAEKQEEQDEQAVSSKLPVSRSRGQSKEATADSPSGARWVGLNAISDVLKQHNTSCPEPISIAEDTPIPLPKVEQPQQPQTSANPKKKGNRKQTPKKSLIAYSPEQKPGGLNWNTPRWSFKPLNKVSDEDAAVAGADVPEDVDLSKSNSPPALPQNDDVDEPTTKRQEKSSKTPASTSALLVAPSSPTAPPASEADDPASPKKKKKKSRNSHAVEEEEVIAAEKTQHAPSVLVPDDAAEEPVTEELTPSPATPPASQRDDQVSPKKKKKKRKSRAVEEADLVAAVESRYTSSVLVDDNAPEEPTAEGLKSNKKSKSSKNKNGKRGAEFARQEAEAEAEAETWQAGEEPVPASERDALEMDVEQPLPGPISSGLTKEERRKEKRKRKKERRKRRRQSEKNGFVDTEVEDGDQGKVGDMSQDISLLEEDLEGGVVDGADEGEEAVEEVVVADEAEEEVKEELEKTTEETVEEAVEEKVTVGQAVELLEQMVDDEEVTVGEALALPQDVEEEDEFIGEDLQDMAEGVEIEADVMEEDDEVGGGVEEEEVEQDLDEEVPVEMVHLMEQVEDEASVVEVEEEGVADTVVEDAVAERDALQEVAEEVVEGFISREKRTSRKSKKGNDSQELAPPAEDEDLAFPPIPVSIAQTLKRRREDSDDEAVEWPAPALKRPRKSNTTKKGAVDAEVEAELSGEASEASAPDPQRCHKTTAKKSAVDTSEEADLSEDDAERNRTALSELPTNAAKKLRSRRKPAGMHIDEVPQKPVPLADGKFLAGELTAEEKGALMNAVDHYRDTNKLPQSQVNDMVQDNPGLHIPLWNLVLSAVPHRKKKKLTHTARKMFHNFVGRGKWTPEQDAELQEAVAQHGERWSFLSPILNRYQDDIRDRWRNHVVCGESRVQKYWDDEEEVELVKHVTEAIKAIEKQRNKSGAADVDGPIHKLVDWRAISISMGGKRSRQQAHTKWERLTRRGDVYVDLTGILEDEDFKLAMARRECRTMSLKAKMKIVQGVLHTDAAASGFTSLTRTKHHEYWQEWGTAAIRLAWFRIRDEVPDNDEKSDRDICAALVAKYGDGCAEYDEDDERGGQDMDGNDDAEREVIRTPSSERASRPGAGDDDGGRRVTRKRKTATRGDDEDEPKRKRGRPRKQVPVDKDEDEDEDEAAPTTSAPAASRRTTRSNRIEASVGRRGRKGKDFLSEELVMSSDLDVDAHEPASDIEGEGGDNQDVQTPAPAERNRDRPRKDDASISAAKTSTTSRPRATRPKSIAAHDEVPESPPPVSVRRRRVLAEEKIVDSDLEGGYEENDRGDEGEGYGDDDKEDDDGAGSVDLGTDPEPPSPVKNSGKQNGVQREQKQSRNGEGKGDKKRKRGGDHDDDDGEGDGIPNPVGKGVVAKTKTPVTVGKKRGAGAGGVGSTQGTGTGRGRGKGKGMRKLTPVMGLSVRLVEGRRKSGVPAVSTWEIEGSEGEEGD